MHQERYLVWFLMLQAESVREAAWGSEWVGTPVPFVRSLSFIINMANKEILLTAGKFVPVSKATMMNVRHYFRCGCRPVKILLKYHPSVRLCAWKPENRWTDIYEYRMMFQYYLLIHSNSFILYICNNPLQQVLLVFLYAVRIVLVKYLSIENICEPTV